MQVTSKGQVTIPMGIRENFGFLPHTEVEFRIENKRIYLEKTPKKSKRSHSLVQRMRGRATVKMTTDEIMELTRGKC